MKLNELRCPNCGANLSFINVKNGKVQCEYCESNYEYENTETETQPVKKNTVRKSFENNTIKSIYEEAENEGNLVEEKKLINPRMAVILAGCIMLWAFAIISNIANENGSYNDAPYIRFDYSKYDDWYIGDDNNNVVYEPVTDIEDVDFTDYAEVKEYLFSIYETGNDEITEYVKENHIEEIVSWEQSGSLVRSYIDDLNAAVEEINRCAARGGLSADEQYTLDEIAYELMEKFYDMLD